jgi:hypothetical protein
MKPTLRSIVSVAIAILTADCTFVTVTKVTPETDTPSTPGQRFSLPRPYIQVTPQADGSIVADVVYLPDPNRTYAITSSSYLASDTLEVTTDGGVIKTINWTGDSSAVVAQGLTSAGNVESAILAAEQKKNTEQQAKVDAASKAVDDARLALSQAQGDLAILIENNATPDAIVKQRIAVNDAVLKLQAAEGSLGKLKGGLVTKADPAGDTPKEKTFGPILFAVREELQTSGKTPTPFLSLVAVNQKFDPASVQSKTPSNPADSEQPAYEVKRPETAEAAEIRIFPRGKVTVRPDKDGMRRLILQVSSPIYQLVAEKNRLDGLDQKPVIPQPPIALDSPTLIDVDLSEIKPGDYTLFVYWQVKKNGGNGQATVDIRIAK